jgi:hypothetical protein
VLVGGNPLLTADGQGGHVAFSDHRLNFNDLDKETGPGVVLTKDSNWEDLFAGSDQDFNDVSFNVEVCATPNILITVDEDGLPGAALDGSPILRPGETNGSENAVAIGVAGTLTALVNFGSDGPHATHAISLAVAGPSAPIGLKSHGGDIIIVSDGSALTGYVDNGGAGFGAGDRAVFTFTVTSGGGYTFTLLDQIDHPDTIGGDNTENLLQTALDLSSYIIARDGDNDTIPLAAGTFKVQILDDMPVITASSDCAETQVVYGDVVAGNVDERGVNGAGDRDLLLTASAFNQGNGAPDSDVNTANDIATGNQHIDGQSTTGGPNGTIIPPETLRIDFVNAIQIDPTSYSGHYDVESASFTIAQIQGSQNNTATVFVQVFNTNDDLNFNNDGSPLPITLADVTVTNNGGPFTLTAVYQGTTLVGVVVGGLNDGAVVKVDTAADFERLTVSNYDGVTVNTSPSGDPVTFAGGSPFAISGITSVVCEPVSLSVTHDESPGFTPQSGPNPENDVNPNTAPSALTTAIAAAGVVSVFGLPGFAVSSGSAAALFVAQPGADEPANISYQLSTSAAGGLFTGQDSGLNTTDGNDDIYLFSDPNDPSIVWGVDSSDFGAGQKVFALYLDGNGQLWTAQFQPIAHNVDGSSAAAHDDIVSITSGLVYVTGTITDADDDQAFAVSSAGLNIRFQDDGPVAFNVATDAVPEGSPAISGVLTFDGGSDGATITHINGQQLTFGNDGWSGPLAGSHGSLRVMANGTYEYLPQADDVYMNGGADQFAFRVTDGDGDTTQALVNVSVVDDADATVVTLNDVTVNEGAGTATISASVTNAPQGTNLVLTLSNSATITILAGQTTGTSTPFPVQGDDPYVDPESYNVSVSNASGGNYESLNTSDTATVTVNDTIHTNFVTLDDVAVLENQTFTYTAHIDYTPLPFTTFTVTLSNGVEITFNPGQFTASSAPQPAQGDDVYVDGQVIPVSIASTSGGNFEAVNIADTATVTITDTLDPTIVTLSDVSVIEGTATATIGATVSNPVTGSPFVITLDNGATITIPVGQSSGTSTAFTVVHNGEDPYVDPQSYPVGVQGTTGGNYEALNTTDTATVTVNDTINTNFFTLDDVVVLENQTFTYTAHMNYASTEDVVVTLSNGVVITFAPGQLTASSAPQPAQGDDVYGDGQVIPVSTSSVSGGNYEAVNTADTATVTVNDTINPTTIMLSDPTVSEGGNVTITATVGSTPQLTDLVITLSNLQQITIPVGQTTGSVTFPVQGDDVYQDGGTFDITMTNATGGNYEQLVHTDTATVTVNDTINPTTITLNDPTVSEGGNVTITATVGSTPQLTDLVITLSNLQQITIPVGQTTGSVTFPVQGDDVYQDGGTFDITMTNATGGNYEQLVHTDTATVTVNDTINQVTATLTADVSSISENGGSIIYTVTLTGGPGVVSPVTQPLVFTLTNGETVTIPTGFTSGTATKTYTDAEITTQANITNSIASVQSGSGQYEDLDTAGTTNVDVNYDVTLTGLDAQAQGGDAVVFEQGLPARSGEPAGSGEIADGDGANNSDATESTTGTFAFTSPDGLGTLTIGTTGISLGALQAASGGSPIAISGGPAYAQLEVICFTGSAAGGTVTYRFTLLDNLATHPNTTDLPPAGDRGTDDPMFLSYNVVVTDTDGSISPTVPLTIAINDDGPTALGDDALTVLETAGVTPGTNLLANDTRGADGATLTHVDFGAGFVAITTGTPSAGGFSFTPAGGQGIYVFSSNGDWTFDPSVNASASDQTANFSYRITDGDGDIDEATQPITVTNSNNPPTIGSVTLTVSEEGVLRGNPDTAGSADITNSATAAGTIAVADLNSDPLTVTFGNPGAVLNSDGQPVTWTGVGTQTLIGSVGAAIIITLTVTNAGGVNVVLSGPIDHANPATEDQRSFFIPVNVSDGQVTTVGSMSVTIEDDSAIIGTFEAATIANQPGTVTGLFALAPGGDGVDHFNITGPATSGITYSSATTSSSGLVTTTLTATADPDGPGGNPAVTVYTLAVRSDGTYTYTLVTPQAATTTDIDVGNLPAGGPSWRETNNGRVEFSSSEGINSNNNVFGVDNPFISNGESFTMEFHNPATVPVTHVDDLPGTDLQLVDAVRLTVSNSDGTVNLHWTATNTVTNVTQSGDVTIDHTGVFLIDPTISFNQITFAATGGQFSQNRFQVSAASYSINVLPQDQQLNFGITATDNDGDTTSSSTLGVHVMAGSGTGSFALIGTEAVDDTFGASTAVDTMAGNTGSDTADYSDSSLAISINLTDVGAASGAPGTFSNPSDGTIGGGDAAGDTLTSIENLRGGSGNDFLFGNSGANRLYGNAGGDTLVGQDGRDILFGGAGSDTFGFAGGASALSISGSGMAGVISGFDVISDFTPGLSAGASERITFSGAAVAPNNTASAVDGISSSLQLHTGSTVASHTIVNGLVTFDDEASYASPVTLTSMADVAAAVQYLQQFDFGNSGASLAFNATIAGCAHTFVFIQGADVGTNNSDVLIDLVGVTTTSIGVPVDGQLGVIGSAVVDPIILDLDHNGIALSSLENGVSFDINGDGAQDQIAWTANGGDGILALDVDGSGKIEGGNELFTPTFNGGNFADGIAALASLDGNHDGVIDSQDAAFGDLVVWQDANHDGVSDSGELAKLGDLGISSIELATTPGAPIDGQYVAGVGSFTYADGTTGTFVEVDLDASLGSADTVVEFDDGGGDIDLSALPVAGDVAPPQQPQGGEAHTPVADAGSTVPAAITIMHEQAALAMQLAAS